MFTKLLAVFGTLALLMTAMLPAVAQAHFNYSTNNGTINITGYTGPSGAVTIPATINGLPVTSIGSYAFYGRTTLASVTIPSSIISIGHGAFAGCTNLTDVTIPDSITYIGMSAFSYCHSLTNVVIPNSVTTIGTGAFEGCSNVTSVMIGNGLTSIELGVFAGCTSLTNVSFGNRVTSIGNNAFAGCSSLMSVTIPNNVTTIGRQAFYFCTSLASVMIGSGVTNIGSDKFFGCSSLTTFSVDADNSAYGSVDGVLFNKSLTTLIQFPYGKTASYAIPSSVISIGSEAFSFCTGLTSVTIHSGVTNIGPYAFNGCTSLTAIAVDADNSAYSTRNGVLFNKAMTTLIQFPEDKGGNYMIPNSVTSIGYSAFYLCSKLTSVTIPGGVTNIGFGAFYRCNNLTSVTISGGITHIEDRAFGRCDSLMGIYFMGDAPSGGSEVFWHSTPATVYYLPGTAGWGPTFGDRPTALWVLPNPIILNNGNRIGVRTNRLGFVISWATNLSVVVEACEDLASPIWTPVSTNTLTDGSSYFSDPQWTNSPTRFYRLRSP